MTILLFGASGRAGGHIARELVSRGLAFTAAARDVSKLPQDPLVTAVGADINDRARLGELLQGKTVLITATRFTSTDADAVLETVRAAGGVRWIVVGGAGSLFIEPGVQVVDHPSFNPQHKSEALAGRALLGKLRGADDIDWLFISPSETFHDGPKLGHYRVGGDEVLRDETGRSHIGFADYAAALVDELQSPRHHCTRITFGY